MPMEPSTKPYLLRAIHEWCTDAGYTPFVAVAVDDSVRVPPEFVKNGEIVLNISALATSRLTIGNEAIEFRARFGGVAREVYVPVARVLAIYARENGQGMAFEVAHAAPADTGAREPTAQLAPPAAAAADGAAPPAPGADAGARAPLEPGERPRLTRVK
jgi:stringent starvation protein B